MKIRKLLYFLAGAPAFYLPVCCVLIIVWAIISALANKDLTPREGSIIWWIGLTGFYGTFVQLPIYVVWALLSSDLSLRLKVIWTIFLILLNMLAIPYFLVFKYRKKTKEGILNLVRRQSAKQWLAKGL